MNGGCVVKWAIGIYLLGAPALLADPPPLGVYAALPLAQGLRLSPDGEKLAMIAPVQDRPALVIRDVEGANSFVLPTGDTLPDWIRWKTASRLLLSVRYTTLFEGDRPIAETRMLFTDADGENITPVRFDRSLPPPGAKVIGRRNFVPQYQDNVISLLPNDPDHVLMQVTPQNDWVHPDAVRVDIHSGLPKVAQPMKTDVTGWLTDNNGVIRGAERLGRDGWGGKETRKSDLVRDSQDGSWQEIDEDDVLHGRRFFPVGFAKDIPNSLYVLTDGASGRLTAYSFDLATRSLGPVLAGDDVCDVEAVHHDYQLVGFTIPCRPDSLVYLDAGWQHDREVVKAALKTNSVSLLDRTADGRRALFSVARTASAPPTYWLLDRRGEKPQLRPLDEAYPSLPPEQIATPRSISYLARDGLKIAAYLTLPVGYKDGPIAFVVMPHGGPTAHDSVRFDWEVQFLISRGYGVLQPQFRGSSGYGKAFEEAGLQQWGRAMQDDVTDGTHWLIEKKLADPAKICIVGASYGGYAALMGVVREPGLYACAAAFAPVTDLDMLVNRLENRTAFKDINIPRIKAEDQDLAETSPAQNADKIGVPVLLVHGRKDFTVPVDHSEAMERALRRAGRKVEAIYLDKADHYFSAGGDRLAWLSALDRFLAVNLAQPPVAATN